MGAYFVHHRLTLAWKDGIEGEGERGGERGEAGRERGRDRGREREKVGKEGREREGESVRNYPPPMCEQEDRERGRGDRAIDYSPISAQSRAFCMT